MKLYSLFRKNGSRYIQVSEHSYPLLAACEVFIPRLKYDSSLVFRACAELKPYPVARRSALGMR